MNPILMHHVTCAMCGKTARVPIDKKTKKIKTTEFRFWGKIGNFHRRKYMYKMSTNKSGNTVYVKERNPIYKKGGPRYLGEYWECRACYSKK